MKRKAQMRPRKRRPVEAARPTTASPGKLLWKTMQICCCLLESPHPGVVSPFVFVVEDEVEVAPSEFLKYLLMLSCGENSNWFIQMSCQF